MHAEHNDKPRRPRAAASRRALAVLALIATGFCAGLAAQAADPTAESLRAARDNAIDGQDYTAAADAAEALFEQLSSNRRPSAEAADAAFISGELQEHIGELRTAHKRFRTSARMNRKLDRELQEIDALYRVAGVLQALGWPDKAINVYNETLNRLSKMERSESSQAAIVELSLARLYAALTQSGVEPLPASPRGDAIRSLDIENLALHAAQILENEGLDGFFSAAEALRLSAQAAEARGDLTAAMNRYEQALQKLAQLAPEAVPPAANLGARIALLREQDRQRMEEQAERERDAQASLWTNPLQGIQVASTVQATTPDGRTVELTVEPGRRVRRPGTKPATRIDAQVTLRITLTEDFTPATQNVVLSQPLPTYGRNARTALSTWRFVPTDDTPADQIEPFEYTVRFDPF